MKEKITTHSGKTTRAVLVYLGTVAISLPIMAICLLLTLSSAFWLNDALEQGMFRYVSRRLLLALSIPGILATLVLNGFIVYHVNRTIEERFNR